MEIHLLKNGRAIAEPFMQDLKKIGLRVELYGEIDDAKVVFDNLHNNTQNYVTLNKVDDNIAAGLVPLEDGLYSVSIVKDNKSVFVTNVDVNFGIAVMSFEISYRKMCELCKDMEKLSVENEELKEKVKLLENKLESLFDGHDYI